MGSGAKSYMTNGLLIFKENKIFLIYKEIQMGSGAKSYFSINMRRPLVIYDFAPDPS
jgi:hypothetical protein